MAAKGRNIRAQAHLWRSRRQEGFTDQEQAEFEAWQEASPAHAEAYAEASLFWEGAAIPGYAEALQDLLDAPTQDNIPLPDTGSYKRNPWTARAFAGVTTIAASIGIAIFVWPLNTTFQEDAPFQRFAAEGRDIKLITLPDRSRITLGPGGTIEMALRDDERLVRLIEGNALFTVTSAQDRPFTVLTPHADVTVTGTRFDLQLADSALTVAVGEGEVDIRRADDGNDARASKALTLTTGEGVQVSAQNGFSEVTEVYPSELAAWQRGRVIYRNTPLKDVVVDLNRYSAIPIELDPSASNLRVSGAFDTKDMEFVFDGLEAIMPVEVARLDTKVVITRRP